MTDIDLDQFIWEDRPPPEEPTTVVEPTDPTKSTHRHLLVDDREWRRVHYAWLTAITGPDGWFIVKRVGKQRWAIIARLPGGRIVSTLPYPYQDSRIKALWRFRSLLEGLAAAHEDESP